MQLSKALYDHYWDKGWVVVEGVFPHAQMDRIARLSLELAEGYVKPENTGYLVDQGEDGRLAPRKLAQPFKRHHEFRDLLTHSELPGLIRQLWGVDPLIVTDQVFFKPPHHGSPKAYHQDNAYFLCHPDDHVVTAWIALDDADEANGCLRYIDGSHRGPILPCAPLPDRSHDLTPDPALIDLSKESLAVVRKGGVVFHHSKTLHTSGPNTSDRWRRGYATHWAAADVVAENDTLDKAYFRDADRWSQWPDEAPTTAVSR